MIEYKAFEKIKISNKEKEGIIERDKPKFVYKEIDEGKNYKVFRVKNERYIFYTKPALLVASHPSIVANEFRMLMKETAKYFSNFLKEFLDFENFVVLSILRAARGYELQNYFDIEVFVRVKYKEFSYGNHINKKPVVTYFKPIKMNEHSCLIIQDTVATGNSVLTALKFLKERIDESLIGKIVLYGYLSTKGIENIINNNPFRCNVISFSLIDESALSSNNYDMPFRGYDIALLKRNEYKTISSFIPSEIFDESLHHFIPSLDQPGDFSERQLKLFNGYGYERGKIEWHLNSKLEEIREIERKMDFELFNFEKEVIKKEKELLRIKR